MADFRLFVSGRRGDSSVNPSGAVLMGLGTESYPAVGSTAADKKWMSFYLTDPAASGTARGMYLRLYLTGGAGGEAVRAFAQVESNTPADTVNGAHISLAFGSSAGNITGLGTAGRFTFHLPSRSLTGTTAAIMAELWSDGSSSTLGGTSSFIRFCLDGNATGRANVDTSGYLFEIAGLTSNVGKLWQAVSPATLAGRLRILIGGTAYYLGVYSGATT